MNADVESREYLLWEYFPCRAHPVQPVSQVWTRRVIWHREK